MPKGKRITAEDIDRLIAGMDAAGKSGMTIKAYCLQEGIHFSTLYRQATKTPRLADAMEDMRNDCAGYWEIQFSNAALGRLKGVDITAMIFLLKNVAGWRDKKEVEHSGNIATSVKLEITHGAGKD